MENTQVLCLNISTMYVFSFQRKELSNAKDVEAVSAKSPVAIAMGTCHSLAVIENNIVGDPLDIKMFEFFKWVATFIAIFPTILCHMYSLLFSITYFVIAQAQ
jgi:magnesium-transporting ATPase (P-type)